MSQPVSDAVQQAREILRGQGIEPTAALPLVQQLKRERAFGYARKILARVRRDPHANAEAAVRLQLAQEHSLCTYKDPDLPPDQRLDRALEILSEVEDLERTRNQETLGLVGALYKRRWELDNQRANLERALFYYRRGYEAAVPGEPGYDYGYTGINAAYVLDLIACQEEEEARAAGTVSVSAAERRKRAREIRRDLTEKLPALEAKVGPRWWFLVTVGEAFFGLPDYETAEEWFRRAAALPDVPDWERESTARQLATLARLQDRDDRHGPAWKALGVLLGGNAFAVQSVFRGKVGLALSGGGFRASLFHVGVLARLAEHDALRHVEVLSCVSGGSIVGAHYYLKVRRLLQEKPDAEITREDYIRLVRELEAEMLAGVQRNIRTRVAAEWTTNLKMLFLPHYSRTMRAGELYEREIYSRVVGDREVWLDDLQVRPKGEPAGFSPKDHNWRRANKVPVLVLNATALNTGHAWQFTTSWMGESPSAVGSEVDGNYRLRRLYYGGDDTPERHRKVRLGHAVAASACVPGLFEPIALPDLYPGRTVRLVDGGVHDNQGTGSLLEQACTVLLVSDASGQMEALAEPSKSPLGGVLRSNSILQARVREAQYHELDARRRSTLIQGLMFIHLKKDLNADPVDWIGCQEPFDPTDSGLLLECRGPLTRYGIQKDVQRRLAALRTDLDSFTEVEAHALMASAYCMTEYELPRCVEGIEAAAAVPRSSWDFLALEPALSQPATPPELVKQLDAGSSLAFKVWTLLWPLNLLAALLGLAAVAALGLKWREWWSVELGLTLGAIATALLFALAGKVFGPAVVKVVRYRKTLADVVLGVAMMSFGFLLARLHLHVFDRLFLWQGRVSRVLGKS